MDNRVFIFLLVTWVTVEGTNTTSGSNWTIILKVFENCSCRNDSLSCFQQKILNFADRMTQSKNLEIFEGFKFVRDEKNGKNVNDLTSQNSGRSLSDEIWHKLGVFFKTHNVELNIPKFYEFNPEEARKKKGGGYGGILLLAGAAKGAMIYMGMHAIAALAGKALIVAKVALTIASVIALKKLLEGSGGKTSYEIIKHPQHSYVQTHSSSHEYGGGDHGSSGGHGGGYEGHYRKRSIAKTRMNGHVEFVPKVEIIGEADAVKFELPEKNPGAKISTSTNSPDEFQWISDVPANERKSRFLYRPAAE